MQRFIVAFSIYTLMLFSQANATEQKSNDTCLSTSQTQSNPFSTIFGRKMFNYHVMSSWEFIVECQSISKIRDRINEEVAAWTKFFNQNNSSHLTAIVEKYKTIFTTLLTLEIDPIHNTPEYQDLTFAISYEFYKLSFELAQTTSQGSNSNILPLDKKMFNRYTFAHLDLAYLCTSVQELADYINQNAQAMTTNYNKNNVSFLVPLVEKYKTILIELLATKPNDKYGIDEYRGILLTLSYEIHNLCQELTQAVNDAGPEAQAVMTTLTN